MITTIMIIWAGVLTLVFTTLLTIAGVGAAFILIPVFLWLGIDIHVSMATALLLNAIAMTFASIHFARKKLIMWKVALPILIIATILSPVGAYVSQGLNQDILIMFFIAFLLFAALMMLFYKPKKNLEEKSKAVEMTYGLGVGGFAGFFGGLLGVGGGNFIVPVLVHLGYDPKKVSATTAFIVIFSSLSGFFGHATLGNISWQLLIVTGIASAIGALIGAWLASDKLDKKHIKMLIGIVLLAVAFKMFFKLI